MNYRKLRIAWSVGCGILGLLLIALWVRSYNKWDRLGGEIFDNIWIEVRSLHGEIGLGGGYDARSPLLQLYWSTHHNLQVNGHSVTADNGAAATSLERQATLGFYFIAGNSNLRISFPHWFPPVLVFALATAPWLCLRFSLRTLLIATTLVAVGLGVVAMMMRGS